MITLVSSPKQPFYTILHATVDFQMRYRFISVLNSNGFGIIAEREEVFQKILGGQSDM